jgi:signal transduction histidine kinase
LSTGGTRAGRILVGGVLVELAVLSPFVALPPAKVPAGVIGAVGLFAPLIVAALVGPAAAGGVALLGLVYLYAVIPPHFSFSVPTLIPAGLWGGVSVTAGLVYSRERERAALGAQLDATRQERDRIAAALHDDVIQAMAATLLILERSRPVRDGEPLATRAVGMLRTTLDETRRLVFELRSPEALHRDAHASESHLARRPDRHRQLSVHRGRLTRGKEQ